MSKIPLEQKKVEKNTRLDPNFLVGRTRNNKEKPIMDIGKVAVTYDEKGNVVNKRN